MAKTIVTKAKAAFILAVSLLLAQATSHANDQHANDQQPAANPFTRVLEIRSYNLKPGTRDRFHRLLVDEAKPLLQRHRIDVVAYGPSLHDADSYFLMRAFPDAAARKASEDAFYGSDEWREGPRDAVLDCIESYTTVVIELDAATVESLRLEKTGR